MASVIPVVGATGRVTNFGGPIYGLVIVNWDGSRIGAATTSSNIAEASQSKAEHSKAEDKK